MSKSTLLNKIIKSRGITREELKKEKRREFKWEELDDTVEFVVENLVLSSERLKVGVLYDVDVDGIFAGYITENYFERKGLKVVRYMNKKKRHGLNEHNVKTFIEDGIDWLFVVDAGSGDGEYIKQITDNGIRVIVLDHHPYDNDVDIDKNMCRILNIIDKPELPKLSGCGVVYRFVERMADMFDDLVGQYEKFVGITVLSDMCDMSEPENRYYVKRAYEEYRGNRFLQQFRFYGSGKSFYSFGVIPYLNACIRIGEERHAMDFVNNMNVVSKMNTVERDRNRVIDKQAKMVDDIYEVSKKYRLKDVVLFLRKEREELRTVGGLVCNKLLAEHNRPALVLNREDGIWKGSLRSNTFKRQVLEEYGFKTMGHDLACGVEVSNENLKYFIKNFEYNGGKVKKKVTFSVGIGKLSEKTWVDLAIFNEFSGVNMESIKVRIKEGVSGALHVDEVSKKKNDIVFPNEVITDFTGKDSDELIVEPILRGDTYQLVRV